MKGRKRHRFVDPLGLLLGVGVTAASVQAPDGARQVVEGLRHPFARLRLLWADQASRGDLGAWLWGLCPWRPVRLEIVKRPEGTTGCLLPTRGLVERSFAWLARSRRLAKAYEYCTQTSEAMLRVAMIHLMLRRLARMPTS